MNPWHDARLLNLIAKGLFGASFVAVLATASWWVVQRPSFALRGLQVEAAPGMSLDKVSSTALRATGRREGRGNFFTVDLDRVRVAFEQLPWVRRASVRRVWPNRLAVAIEEHRPFAIWNETRLVNSHGELFSANLSEAEESGPLPAFSGPNGSEGQVVARFAELTSWMQPIGRKPESLALSPRWAWTVRLDDGTTLMLGRDQGVPMEERVRRWVGVFPQVQARLDRKAEVIDLRYPNGFAIRSVALLAAETANGEASTPKVR